MAIFKKKPQVDPREKAEEAIEKAESFVRQAEYKRKSLLEKAKTAKARGDKMSYKMAVGGLRMIMQQQKVAQQMALAMQVAMDMKDISGMTASFMDNMQYMCVELGRVPSMKKMTKVAAEFGERMEKMNAQTEMMGEMMSAIGDQMSEGSFDSAEVSDEIGMMIDRELASELSDEELAIEREVASKKGSV